MVQRRPEQSDVLSKQSMDVLMTFMQEQMKHFEDRLKMELLGRLRGSAVQRSAQAAASLEEKLLLQIQRVQQEGERLREPRETPRETPRREESSEEPGSDGRRDDNHESDRETVKELLINFRKLAAELQMQITRLDRLDMDIGGRLGGLEEGIRRLDAENAKLTEHFTESARRLAAPVGLAEDLHQAVRSLEEALESWQSHTQHLEDDLRSRMEELSQSVARLEPSKGQSHVQASPKGQSSPSRASPAKRTIPSPTSTAFLNLVSILPAHSPSSQDKDALVGMGRADSPRSDDEAVPSLAVPLLAGAEEPLPAEDAFRALEGFPGEPVCVVDGQGASLEIGPDPEVVRQALSDLAETRERIRQLREASAQHPEAREAFGGETTLAACYDGRSLRCLRSREISETFACNEELQFLQPLTGTFDPSTFTRTTSEAQAATRSEGSALFAAEGQPAQGEEGRADLEESESLQEKTPEVKGKAGDGDSKKRKMATSGEKTSKAVRRAADKKSVPAAQPGPGLKSFFRCVETAEAGA
eukprot:s2434_g7.t1